MVGDGYCNDETNNIHCAFDGGDCCHSLVIKTFCSDCKCLTGNSEVEINHLVIGDGYCHDEMNNATYSYDGGDCCGCVVTKRCSECACLGQVTDNAGITHPLAGDGSCNDETNNIGCSYDFGDCCPNSNLMGNYICNDETNIPECHFDGGDCCLSNVNTDHCSECSCSVNGVITSPGFPQNYDNNLDLTWLIQLPLGQYIEIDFVSFDVEYHDSCG